MDDEPRWLPDPYDRTRLRWWDGTSWSMYVAKKGVVTTAPLEAVPPAPPRRLPIWAWLLIAAAGILVIFLLPRVALVAAVVALVTGIFALRRGTPTWLRLPSRNVALTVTVGAAVVTLLTSALIGVPTSPAQEQEATGGAVPFVAEPEVDEEPEAPTSTFRDETATEPIAFEESTVEDPNLPSGETRVATPGQAGERTYTYRVEYLDGQEVSRELVSEVVTVQPVTQVIAVGTYVAPPPPPPADNSGCDPNYADACVPISSDVDCAWGSGNGPAYFDGVARVVGVDIYDLDRDGDGYACEQ